MSRVEEIESRVKELSSDELTDFRSWFFRFDADLWDKQIEADAENGRLRSLARRALDDHKKGLSTPL